MITAERKAELQAKGYAIEDMEAADGPGWWSGMHRWMNAKLNDFQDGFPSSTAEDAWISADEHDRATVEV